MGILLRRVIKLWLKSLTFFFSLILIPERSKNNIPDVSSLLNYAINVTSNYCQEVIDLGEILKNHVEAFPLNVCGNNPQMTSSYSTFIKFKAIINCLTWYSGNTPSLGSYLGKILSRCLGNGCEVPGMAITLIESHYQYVSMFIKKLQISQEDGI